MEILMSLHREHRISGDHFLPTIVRSLLIFTIISTNIIYKIKKNTLNKLNFVKNNTTNLSSSLDLKVKIKIY